MAVVELNNQLRELELEERKEIEKILKELTQLVAGGRRKYWKQSKKILQELDFIFAKGRLALEMNATKPVLNHNGYMNIKKSKTSTFRS